MNIVKLYTANAQFYVSVANLVRFLAYPSERKILTILDKNGNPKKGKNSAETEAYSHGVHVENLFASKELAIANRERIFAEMKQRVI
jgi:hypothetical protein